MEQPKSEWEGPPNKTVRLDDTTKENGASTSAKLTAVDVEVDNHIKVEGKSELDLLAVIPPEVWELIFSNLESSPDDFHSVLNTCNRWYQMLSDKKSVVLFPKILPLIAPFMSPNVLLKCRLVCKAWKRCIDKNLQEYPLSVKSFESHWFHSDSPFDRVSKRLDKRYNFKGSRILRVMEKMKDMKTPFISRSMSVRLGKPENDFERDNQATKSFLGKYGSQLWEFNMFCYTAQENEDAVQKIPGILEKLPNLRALNIEWITHPLSQVPRDVLEGLRQNEVLFPTLEHLRSLDFNFPAGGILEKLLGEALVRSYGNQLTTFICRGELFEIEFLNREHLPNLKNLRIFSVTEPALEKLSQIRNLPLQRLQLWHSSGRLPFVSLIRAINPFSQSLRQLHMDVSLELPDFFEGNSEETVIMSQLMSIEFPYLLMLSAPLSSVNSNWFWDAVKMKFMNLERIDFQTAREPTCSPREAKYLKKEVDQCKRSFYPLRELQNIYIWCPKNLTLVLKREQM